MQSISGNVYTTYSKMGTIFNTKQVLHGSHVSRQEQYILFVLWGKKMLFLMQTILIFPVLAKMATTSFVLMLIGPCCCLVLRIKIFGIRRCSQGKEG